MGSKGLLCSMLLWNWTVRALRAQAIWDRSRDVAFGLADEQLVRKPRSLASLGMTMGSGGSVVLDVVVELDGARSGRGD